MKPTLYIFITLLSLLITQAQEIRNDDLGDVSDEFQTAFFEAIKQKGIENYDKAIGLLEKCNTEQPNNAAVNFELGKNYYELDKLQLAENALQKANSLKPNNQWILETLYGLYRSQKNSSKVIETLENLNKVHPKYATTLVEFYYKNQQHDEALSLLTKLDEKGTNRSREQLRHQVYLHGGRYSEQTKYLEQKTSNKTASETDFIKLIYAYSKLKNQQKSFKAAVLYATTYPNSDVPHLSLYKFHMTDNAIDKAIISMNTVLKSEVLHDNEKSRVLNDFFNFTKNNTTYLPQLEKATELYRDVTIISKMALLYSSTNNEKSTEYISSITKNNATSYDDLKLLGTVFLKENRIEDALKNSEKALSLFPAQPIFYLQQAKAQNKNNQAKAAIESLELGLDYLIDNSSMEASFYTEMSKSYGILKDKKKQEIYLQRAKKLSK